MEEKLKLFNKYFEERVATRTEELREKNVELMNEIAERKRVEKELRESEVKYRQITSTATDAIMVFDSDTRQFVDVNKACEEIYGYTREEFLNMKHTDITADVEVSEKSIQEAIDGKLHNIPLRYHRKKDGTVFPVEISASSFVHKGRKVLCGMIRNITERRRVEEQIKASLKEKEVLLDEVHHRVKNNLQIISSLLDMSSMQTQNQETIKLFAESRSRVESMALIHSQLYGSERFDEIDMQRHIQELSGNLLNIYSKEKTIALEIQSANVYLPVTLAVPCALVLNELISNSMKHAYRDGQQGTISISMQQSNDGTTLLKVKDNGVGIPEDIDIERTKSLGLKLARNIVYKQLNGTMNVVRNEGTEFTVEFKHSKEGS